MNGKGQAAVGAIMIAMLGWLITDQRALRTDVAALRSEVHQDIGDLRERMVRMEGRLDSLENVIVQVFTKR